MKHRRYWVFALSFPIVWTFVSAFLWGWTGFYHPVFDLVVMFGPGYAALAAMPRDGGRRVLIARLVLLTFAYGLMYTPLFLLGFTIVCAVFGACI